MRKHSRFIVQTIGFQRVLKVFSFSLGNFLIIDVLASLYAEGSICWEIKVDFLGGKYQRIDNHWSLCSWLVSCGARSAAALKGWPVYLACIFSDYFLLMVLIFETLSYC